MQWYLERKTNNVTTFTTLKACAVCKSAHGSWQILFIVTLIINSSTMKMCFLPFKTLDYFLSVFQDFLWKFRVHSSLKLLARETKLGVKGLNVKMALAQTQQPCLPPSVLPTELFLPLWLLAHTGSVLTLHDQHTPGIQTSHERRLCVYVCWCVYACVQVIKDSLH